MWRGDGAQRDFGKLRSIAGKMNTTMKWTQVTAMARIGRPAPAAMPIAAVSQTMDGDGCYGNT